VLERSACDRVCEQIRLEPVDHDLGLVDRPAQEIGLAPVDATRGQRGLRALVRRPGVVRLRTRSGLLRARTSRGFAHGFAHAIGVDVEAAGGIASTVVTTEPLGGETVVDLEVGDRITKALVDPSLSLADGQPTTVSLDPRRLHLFDGDGEALLSAAGDDILRVRVR